MIQDLSGFPFDNDKLVPYGSRGVNDPKHPERWHATTGTIDGLELAGDLYRDYQLEDNLLKMRGVAPLSIYINDISLPWGGLFDVNANWKPPHDCHRFGKESDVRITHLMNGCREGSEPVGGTPQEKAIKMRQYALLMRALIKAGGTPQCHGRGLGNHFHVYWEDGQELCRLSS